MVPDISNTQIQLLMLAQNQIQLFSHNYTEISWPSTLTHVLVIIYLHVYFTTTHFYVHNINILRSTSRPHSMLIIITAHGIVSILHQILG